MAETNVFSVVLLASEDVEMEAKKPKLDSNAAADTAMQ